MRLWGVADEIAEVKPENIKVYADMSAVTGPGPVTVPVAVTITDFSDVTVRGTYELEVSVTNAPLQPEPDASAESAA